MQAYCVATLTPNVPGILMTYSRDKWIWVPILAVGIGGAIPLWLVDLSESSWQYRTWGAVGSTMAIVTYLALKKIGKKWPSSKAWATDTMAGATVLLFVGTFVASGLGVLFALLPMAHWLHIAITIGLVLLGLVLLVNESQNS